MTQHTDRCRPGALRPTFLGLEDRRMLDASSAFGAAMGAGVSAWFQSIQHRGQGQGAGGDTLTYSFPPDGTQVYGLPNTLNAAMAARGISTAHWQGVFEEAAAIWSAASGIHLELVPDDGAPIATSGSTRTDPRSGDIRITGIDPEGVPQFSRLLAGAFVTPPGSPGVEAGDIVVNDDQPWVFRAVGANGRDPAAAGIDLLTVALHELGHSLGAGHVGDRAAVMYEGYLGPKHVLTPADHAAIPGGDAFEGDRTTPAMNSQAWDGTLSGAGDFSTVRLVVENPGFFVLGTQITGGQVSTELSGPNGPVALIPGTSNGLFLASGEYCLRVANVGPGPASFRVSFTTPAFEPEALLLNGVGQYPAASLALITPAVASPRPSGPSATPPASLTPAALGPLPITPVAPPAAWAGLPLTPGGEPVGRPPAVADRMTTGPGVGQGVTARAFGLPGGAPGMGSGLAATTPPPAREADPTGAGATIPPATDGALLATAGASTRSTGDDAVAGIAGWLTRVQTVLAMALAASVEPVLMPAEAGQGGVDDGGAPESGLARDASLVSLTPIGLGLISGLVFGARRRGVPGRSPGRPRPTLPRGRRR